MIVIAQHRQHAVRRVELRQRVRQFFLLQFGAAGHEIAGHHDEIGAERIGFLHDVVEPRLIQAVAEVHVAQLRHAIAVERFFETRQRHFEAFDFKPARLDRRGPFFADQQRGQTENAAAHQFSPCDLSFG